MIIMPTTIRIIRSKLDNNILIIKIPQFGLDLHYEIIPLTTIDIDTKFDDGIPDFATSASLKFIKIVKHKNIKSHDEIKEILRKESIIPPDLEYDHMLLGFVYATDSDPNNHRWWLDFRNSKDQSVYNYFGDRVEINCPITTKAWHDSDPNGIWHGRFVFSSNELKSIIEEDIGILKINGKLRTECKPLDINRVCNITNVPENTVSLRLRYNIREDIWFCDILDKEDKQIGQIPCKSIICDAKMYGQITMIGGKPRVSTRVNINDISDIAIAINSLIIRGK